MPYIKPERRKEMANYTCDGDTPKTPGELNYAITCLCDRYLATADRQPPKYFNYNEVIGALECAKLELYRRLLAPYEERSIAENGDVYTVYPS